MAVFYYFWFAGGEGGYYSGRKGCPHQVGPGGHEESHQYTTVMCNGIS